MDSLNQVVVDFHAEWCGPCKRIKPQIEQFSQTHHNVIFLAVDVDQQSSLAEKYSVEAMPTFIFIKQNNQVATVVGANVKKIQEQIALLE